MSSDGRSPPKSYRGESAEEIRVRMLGEYLKSVAAKENNNQEAGLIHPEPVEIDLTIKDLGPIVSEKNKILSAKYWLQRNKRIKYNVKSDNILHADEGRPSSEFIDNYIPVEDAEGRILALDTAYEKWVIKYGKPKADRLYRKHSFLIVGMYWFDKVFMRVWARK